MTRNVQIQKLLSPRQSADFDQGSASVRVRKKTLRISVRGLTSPQTAHLCRGRVGHVIQQPVVRRFDMSICYGFIEKLARRLGLTFRSTAYRKLSEDSQKSAGQLKTGTSQQKNR